MALDEEHIHEMMRKFNERIGSPVEDPMSLAQAMDATKVGDQFSGKNHRNHRNEALATLGDAVLRLVLAEMLFDEGSKGIITEKKKTLENNKTLHLVFEKWGLYEFAFTENGFYGEVDGHQRVPNRRKHSPYIEAIIGAIYKESGLEATRRWILEWYVPRAIQVNQDRSE